jgi:anti-anti-sigma regulatory factor
LHDLCRAAERLLHSWPMPQTITLDLSQIAALQGTTAACLERACRRWASAGVRVCIEGCNLAVIAALERVGVAAELLVSERPSGDYRLVYTARGAGAPPRTRPDAT